MNQEKQFDHLKKAHDTLIPFDDLHRNNPGNPLTLPSQPLSNWLEYRCPTSWLACISLVSLLPLGHTSQPLQVLAHRKSAAPFAVPLLHEAHATHTLVVSSHPALQPATHAAHSSAGACTLRNFVPCAHWAPHAPLDSTHKPWPHTFS